MIEVFELDTNFVEDVFDSLLSLLKEMVLIEVQICCEFSFNISKLLPILLHESILAKCEGQVIFQNFRNKCNVSGRYLAITYSFCDWRTIYLIEIDKEFLPKFKGYFD